MNKLLTTGLLFMIFLSSYGQKAPKNIKITHFNITFAPDLSNRVDPRLFKRPLGDVDILRILTTNLYPTILNHNRFEYQKDKLLIDFINKSLISQYQVQTDRLLVDFGTFNRQYDRMAYILERDHVKKFLQLDIRKMTGEFSRVNRVAMKQNFGADIWTYFNEGIDDKRVLSANKPIVDRSNQYINAYRNVLVLTTDGYIEAGIYDKGFDLSKKRIENFRTSFIASGETDLNHFFKKNKKFRITPVRNPHLKELEVLVMELYDRSKSKGGAATVQPTDMEIIRLFWSDWLGQCGVKRFELHPYANSKDEAEKIILQFLGVNKK